MKIHILVLGIVLGLVASAQAMQSAPKLSKNTDAGHRIYVADLYGNADMMVVETYDKMATESLTTVTIKNRTGVIADTVNVGGRISSVRFRDFNLDRRQRIFIDYKDASNLAHLVVYELHGSTLSQIFSASSDIGIDVETDVVARIKIGRKSLTGAPTPVWESWVWSGQGFARE